MKRVISAAVAALLSVLLLASCGDPGEFTESERLSAKQKRNADITVTYNYSDGAQDPPTDYGNYINGVTEFSLSQFRALYKESSGSFVFSPAVSALQTALLSDAASGDTRQEILLALGGTLTQDGLNACSSYFKSRLEAVSKIGQKETPEENIRLKGAMLIDSSIDVKTSFLQSAKDYYGFDIFRYDFNGEHASDKLGAYLKPYTSDSGIDVSKSGTLNTLGALSLNDKWLESYKDGDIFSGSFKGAQGEQTAVYLSSDESRLSSGKADGILKYTSKNPLKLVLITPKDGKLDEYAGNLDGAELNALLGSIDITKKSAAAFPEFTIKTDGKAKAMSQPLSQSGLYSLFSGKSGFSSLSYGSGAALGEVYEIPQEFSLTRAGINKDSSGGKAASELKADKDTLVFDRPFIFMLLDNESNLPVYIGVYR